MTVREIERSIDTAILEVDIIESDAQGGPFSIIRAAVNIGEQLDQTHFTLVDEYEIDGLYFYKIFFTSDTSIHPNDRFDKKLSEELERIHAESGYFSISEYKSIF